ncbi:MAG: hypothetical protein ACI9KE_006305 [Polyangiales bacterium]
MRVTSLALLLGILVACGDDAPPPPTPFDAGPRDTSAADDTAPEEDGGTDAGVVGDVETSDAGPQDAGEDAPAFDANFPDSGPPPPVMVCEPGTPMPMCRANCRDEGFVCVDAFCGGRECAPGTPCTQDVHCGSGNCVQLEGAGPEDSGLCESSAGACAAINDCAYGFRCEEGGCVDRRIPCGFHENACPRGHTCTFAPVEGALFCVPSHLPCDSAGQCEAGASCVDVDGDSETECLLVGTCSSNSDCGEGLSCGVDPGTSQATCEVDGPCRSGECPAGRTCLDTGTGTARCVTTGGSCTQDSECEPQAICGAIEPDDPLRCLTFDEDAD